MALYDRQHDPAATDHRHMTPINRTPTWYGGILLPLILAAAIAVALAAAFYPGSEGQVGDTNNAGAPARTVTPSPTPSTSPAIPTPTPRTAPSPTQRAP